MTNKDTKLSFLYEQSSVPAAQLVEPAPHGEQLEAILQSAMSAPDHGELTPYRFIIIEGESRHKLSEVFASAAEARGLDATSIEKQRLKPLRSPLIICVVACLQDSPKIPQIEQLLSAGCAAQHIQLACRMAGFGSIWLTGDNCYDNHVLEALGLGFEEKLIGLLYLGTPKEKIVSKSRKSVTDKISHWHEPQVTDFAI